MKNKLHQLRTWFVTRVVRILTTLFRFINMQTLFLLLYFVMPFYKLNNVIEILVTPATHQVHSWWNLPLALFPISIW